VKGNVVVITGASRGIGAELARQLAGKGARLALSGRDRAALEQVAAECRALGAEARAIPADVTVEESCRSLMERAAADFGRIDTLVNNAGISMWARFADLEDVSVLARIMQVNYMGSVYCTRHALVHLLATRGRIVGVASLAGLTGVPTRTGYAASKHAMRGFFDSLRIELADSGVSVTMIYPGFVATAIRATAAGYDGQPMKSDPVAARHLMSVEECARQMIRAIERRSRELVMTTPARIGAWVKLLAPGLVDRVARRAVERPG
jgi:short-subunit dehydrogenase